MVNKNLSFSLVTNGTKSCSGRCNYCSAASSMHYNMNVDKSKLRDELIRINKQNEEESVFDYNKLEEKLDNHKPFQEGLKLAKEGNKVSLHVDIWGADGLNNFTSLQNNIEFLEYYADKHNLILDPHTSTNGLACYIDEWCDYLHEHNIKLQLSHDGLGQWMRTDNYDPMDMPNVRSLFRDGTINWVNTTLNFWNYSIFSNIDYWNSKLKIIFPEVWDRESYCSEEIDEVYRRLYIKLNHIYDSTYDIRAKNKEGRFGNNIYESLVNSEIGDLALRNRRDLADKYNIPELGHVLDNYISEWYKAFNMFVLNSDKYANDPSILPYKNYISEQCNRHRYLRNKDDISGGACRCYQRGLKDYTFVIDTTGRYSECNLIDADHHVLNPHAEQPEYCSSCKYRLHRECNSCGSVTFPDKCEYKYRWCQFLESISPLINKKGANNASTRPRTR